MGTTLGTTAEVDLKLGLYHLWIGPAEAEQILKHNYDGQRALRQAKVDRYSQEMARGRFRINLIELVEVEGRKHLTNGQHTLHAICRSGSRLYLPVRVTSGISIEDVREVYRTTDLQEIRRFRDVYDARDLAARSGVPPETLLRCTGASALFLAGFDQGERSRVWRGGISHADRAEWLEEWAGDVGELYRVVQVDAFRKYASRAAVLSVALATVRHQKTASLKFWTRVLDMVGLQDGDPEYYLARFLRGEAGDNFRMKVDPVYGYAARVALCWNASVEGRRLAKTLLKLQSVGEGAGGFKPIPILGTPYVIRLLPPRPRSHARETEE